MENLHKLKVNDSSVVDDSRRCIRVDGQKKMCALCIIYQLLSKIMHRMTQLTRLPQGLCTLKSLASIFQVRRAYNPCESCPSLTSPFFFVVCYCLFPAFQSDCVQFREYFVRGENKPK